MLVLDPWLIPPCTDYALQMAYGNFTSALFHFGGQNVAYNGESLTPSGRDAVLTPLSQLSLLLQEMILVAVFSGLLGPSVSLILYNDIYAYG